MLASPARAIDSLNLLTLNLKMVAEGDVVAKGNNLVHQVETLRGTSRDFINIIGNLKGTTFTARAQILILRRNFGQENEIGSVIIREPGLPDCDIGEYIGFRAGEAVASGTVNLINGRAQVTLQYIGTLGINIPDFLSFIAAGATVDKGGTSTINGETVENVTFSVAGNLAGEGAVTVGGANQLLIVEGTIRLGPTKFVPSAE